MQDIHVWDAIIVVKTMAMQTTWIGGKSVAKTTGKLIKGPRTSSGTPNHQLSNRNRKTKKRTAATRWSCLWALHFGTYQVAVQIPAFLPDSSNRKSKRSWRRSGETALATFTVFSFHETVNSRVSILTAKVHRATKPNTKTVKRIQPMTSIISWSAVPQRTPGYFRILRRPLGCL